MKKFLAFFVLLMATLTIGAQTIYECEINDPDGYTNVRKGESSSSAIVGRFNDGEIFYSRPSVSNWWPVYYSISGSKIGYMHKSRISILRTVSSNEKSNNGLKQSAFRRAVINDPDGYTNVRKTASSNSAIVDRIYDGQIFYYTAGSGNWYKVYYSQGGSCVGYIHKSRVRNY